MGFKRWGLLALTLLALASSIASVTAGTALATAGQADSGSVAALSVSPNDPGYLIDTWAQIAAGLPPSWAVEQGDHRVVIAVLDRGCNATVDLAPNLVPGWNVAANNGDTSDVYVPNDLDVYHGTQMCSIIGDAINNNVGTAGACPKCAIMPVKITDDLGHASDQWIAQGINWAYQHGANIISISYMSPAFYPADPAIHNAIEDAQANGTLVVQEAGNGQPPGSPGSGDPAVNHMASDNQESLCVAGVDSKGAVVPQSDHGQWCDVAAPWEVASYWGTGIGGNAGTSASTALTAGIAGLVQSYRLHSGAARLSVADLQAVLCDTVAKSGIDVRCAGGVNAYNALKDPRVGYKPAHLSIAPPTGGRVIGSTGRADEPSGLACGGPITLCSSEMPPGTSITLTAVPSKGLAFGGWGGACSGLNPTCTVSVNGETTITATFGSSKVKVTVHKPRQGSVTSLPTGVSCKSSCTSNSALFPVGSIVNLKAKPPKGFGVRWSGACKGTKTACTLRLARSVTTTISWRKLK